MMTTHQVYVLHSAYPDGTWRGLEKCCGTTVEGMHAFAIFWSLEEAQTALDAMGDGSGYHVFEVTLVTPMVRQALDSAIEAKVAARLLFNEES